MLGPLLVGVVVGLLWWQLAPVATVQRAGSVVYSAAHPEVQAAQTGVFTLLSVGAGLVCGIVAGVRPGGRPLLRSVVVILAGVAGVAVAAGVGALLGPASIAGQVAAHTTPLTSPLRVDAHGAYLVWPGVCALALAVGHALAARGEDPGLLGTEAVAGAAPPRQPRRVRTVNPLRGRRDRRRTSS